MPENANYGEVVAGLVVWRPKDVVKCAQLFCYQSQCSGNHFLKTDHVKFFAVKKMKMPTISQEKPHSKLINYST